MNRYCPALALSPPLCPALLSEVSSFAWTAIGKSSGLDLGRLPLQTPPLSESLKLLYYYLYINHYPCLHFQLLPLG